MFLKKVVFFTLLLVSAGLLVVNYVGTASLCGGIIHRACVSNLYGLFSAILIVFPALVFSVITYFLSQNIFQTWFKFSVVWIPLSVVVALVASDVPGMWAPSDQAVIDLLSPIFYTLISIIIIISGAIHARNKMLVDPVK